jgi:hypothetical protein
MRGGQVMRWEQSSAAGCLGSCLVLQTLLTRRRQHIESMEQPKAEVDLLQFESKSRAASASSRRREAAGGGGLMSSGVSMSGGLKLWCRCIGASSCVLLLLLLMMMMILLLPVVVVVVVTMASAVTCWQITSNELTLALLHDT